MTTVFAPRYRLGAEELLELGRCDSGSNSGRRPFLSGRARRMPILSQAEWTSEQVYFLDLLGGIAGFLAEGLSLAFTWIGNLIDVPLQILAQGVDIAFNGVAGLLGQIPILGPLLSQVMVLGGALIKFGLSIPGLVLKGLGNVLGGFAKALKGSASESENQKGVDEAKEEITDRAPDHIKDTVKAVLDASGVSGKDLTPNVDEDSGTPEPETPGEPGGPVRRPGEPEGADWGTIVPVGLAAAGVIGLVFALA